MREVDYDEDGCYAPDQYMAAVNSGDVFQDYSFFIGNTDTHLFHTWRRHRHACIRDSRHLRQLPFHIRPLEKGEDLLQLPPGLTILAFLSNWSM